MKSIMISIKPEWVEKILNGEKTIEIRKTIPKCELPVKVYIYCTKDKSYLYRLNDDNEFELTNKLRVQEDCFVKDYNAQNGKIVAEFILKKTECWRPKGMLWGTTTKKTCLSLKQLIEYADTNNKPKEHCFAWFISDLVVYDKPKELSEFYKNNYKKIIDDLEFNGCEERNCKFAVGNSFIGDDGFCDYSNCPKLKLNKPPQSWCYVED